MSLSSFAVNAPVKVTMFFFAVLLLGWISLTRMPTNLFPDIRAPRYTVSVTTQGLSPAEVERRICESIERSLYTIRGVTSVESIARADSAVIIVNFNWSTKLNFAFLEVKKAVSDLQRDRAEDIQSATVLSYDPNATPIITAALEAPEGTDAESIFRTAEQTLKPRFERLEGVANVSLAGGLERELVLRVQEAQLLAYNINVSDIVTALKNDNVDATGGWVEEGARRYLLKAIGQFRDAEQVKRVTVARRGDRAVMVSDVAEVVMAPKEATSIVTLDGKPAVGLAFFREAESNTVAVAKAVREEIANAKNFLPQGWKITIANDQSLFITAAIREVMENAVSGGVLAILVLLIFLRDFRTTAIIAITIPISIVATFNLMYFQGLSLNLMSLGGLALGAGMLVDNSIVVLENIFRRRQLGDSPREAARVGSREVGGALVASTLTTVAVFLPLAYSQGISVMLFKEQALTVAFSQLASLIAGLVLIPMLCAYFLSSVPKDVLVESSSLKVPRTFYARLLALCLRFRVVVVLLSILLLGWSALAITRLPQEFLPETKVSQIGIRLVLPNGTAISSTERIATAVEGQLGRFAPAIDRIYTRIGESQGIVNANSEDPDGPNTADILVSLKSTDKPTTAALEAGLGNFDSKQLIAGLKPTLDRLTDVKTEFKTGQGSIMELVGSSRAPLLVEINGRETEQLSILAMEVARRLGDVPELLNIRTNILDGAPEVMIRPDAAQLARNGMDVSALGTLLRQRIDGEIATQIKRDSGDVDLRVEVDYGRESIDMLRDITFRTPTGALVRLGDVATFEVVRAPREIVRKRQERIAYVMADLAPGMRLSQGIAKAQLALNDMPLPLRYGLRYTGEEEQRADAFGNLKFALILSIFLVYMVMASVFESFLQPFLILFTIPMAAVGVVLALQLGGQSLNVMSIIGIIMLGGIVVNNGIVLLDCVNQVRADGAAAGGISETDSLLVGCARRLRPVLMTSGTTTLGLLPMSLGYGEGAELRQAMALTVLGGMVSSTILTLFVIPCCQSLLDTARSAVTGVLGRRRV